ncbi:hypothetical protein NIES22_33490 [Calothrix brevissima NIES-22]|nr:hypothetical protein NIES22_33490 [Calothrix brevissima NIES-22]
MFNVFHLPEHANGRAFVRGKKQPNTFVFAPTARVKLSIEESPLGQKHY